MFLYEITFQVKSNFDFLRFFFLLKKHDCFFHSMKKLTSFYPFFKLNIFSHNKLKTKVRVFSCFVFSNPSRLNSLLSEFKSFSSFNLVKFKKIS